MSNALAWRFGQVPLLSRHFVVSSVRSYATSTREMTAAEQALFDKLDTRFQPSSLDVADVSGGCGTFYAISITSGEFNGLPVVKQHKLVTETLKSDIAGFHGLQIKTKAE